MSCCEATMTESKSANCWCDGQSKALICWTTAAAWTSATRLANACWPSSVFGRCTINVIGAILRILTTPQCQNSRITDYGVAHKYVVDVLLVMDIVTRSYRIIIDLMLSYN